DHAALGVNVDALAVHLARIPTSQRLNAQKTFFINELHDEADLIHVGGEHELLGVLADALSHTMEIAHDIGSHFTEALQLFAHDLADLIFLAGNAGRFGEAFEQFGVHLMVLPGFSNLVRYAKVTHSEEL